MKESVLKTDKNIVFKETFGSEDLVRANGGTPTAVTFSNGVGSFLLSSSSKISYNKIFSGTGSAGNTNLFIGNTNAGDRTFDGLQSNVRIIDGILSTAEISQLYLSEKTNYGL